MLTTFTTIHFNLHNTEENWWNIMIPYLSTLPSSSRMKWKSKNEPYVRILTLHCSLTVKTNRCTFPHSCHATALTKAVKQLLNNVWYPSTTDLQSCILHCTYKHLYNLADNVLPAYLMSFWQGNNHYFKKQVIQAVNCPFWTPVSSCLQGGFKAIILLSQFCLFFFILTCF